MSGQQWTGNTTDRSGVAIFSEGDVTVEVPLLDVRFFNDLTRLITEARRISATAERERVYSAIERALKP
jgi:hypothetical protein